MTVVRATVVSFNSTTWTALVSLHGAIAEVQLPLAEWLPTANLVADDEVAVLLFDQANPQDGLIIGKYGGTGLGGQQGTWTPAFTGSTTAGVFTYTNQQGYYYKLASALVFVNGRVSISAIGTPPAGTMSITGLPVLSAATYQNGVWFSRIGNFNYTNTAFELTGRIGSTGTSIALEETFDNAVHVAAPAANFTNAACDLIFGGLYMM